MRTFLAANPLLRRRTKRTPLPVWFTLNDVAKTLGIRRNSAKWYVQSQRLRPVARTASGVALFDEETVNRFLAWRKKRKAGR